ncbi:hypothetical protein CK203_100134 [Vitis vinifera]|uniref:Uncharacterized protein n=1 Tax=Vitis vinifera TaxID=29760 RepID=A0A438C8K2_VITVI|nr:hypothetical protein CK203_100134 [Vitis vinifera]
MCGGDDHLAWKRPVSSKACRGLRAAGGWLLLISLLRHGFDSGGYSWLLPEDRWAVGRQIEVALPPIKLPIPALEDPHAQGTLVASLLAKFRMPEIKRYIGIGYPGIHLRLSSMVMRTHGLDEAQMSEIEESSLESIANQWKVRNMKNRSFKVLRHKQIRNARRGSKQEPAMNSGSQQSNASNGVRFEVETKELQPLQADHSS